MGYQIKPNNLLLQPKDPKDNEKYEVTLIAKPRFLQRWRRPWKGEGRVIPFNVGISNLKEDGSLSLLESKSATLVWKPHPSWQLWLLMIIPTVLGLVAVAALVYLGVWSFIVQPSLKPKITEFVTTEKSYQAGQGDAIRLNWEIRNLAQLKKINVTGLHNEAVSFLFEYNFLKEGGTHQTQSTNTQYCNLPQQKSSKETQTYECNLLKEYIDNKGNRQLEKVIITQVKPQSTKSTSESKKRGYCTLETIPYNNSVFQSLWKKLYFYWQEMKDYIEYEKYTLNCRKIKVFDLTSISYKSYGQSTGEKEKILETSQENETIKKEINEKQAGNFEFKIETFTNEISDTKSNKQLVEGSRSRESWYSQLFKHFQVASYFRHAAPANKSGNLSASKIIKDIKVAPAPPPPPELPLPQPDIQMFASASPVYRQPDLENAKVSKSLSQSQLTKGLIKLNWIVANPKTIARLEMKTVLTGLDGTIPNPVSKSFSFLSPNKSLAQKKELFVWGVPSSLPCRLQDNDRLLICENIPIDVKVPGQYKFTLTAIPLPEEKTKDIKLVSKTIEAVQIKPMLPQITNFKVNEQDVLQNPNQILMVEPGKSPADIFLSWKVKNPKQMTVELLPAPGQLPSSANEMRYKLSPNPGSTSITLKVTNQVGESVTRTVVLETAVNVQPQVKPGTPLQVTPPPPPPDGAAPSSNSPLNPEDLPPFELPPRTN